MRVPWNRTPPTVAHTFIFQISHLPASPLPFPIIYYTFPPVLLRPPNRFTTLNPAFLPLIRQRAFMAAYSSAACCFPLSVLLFLQRRFITRQLTNVYQPDYPLSGFHSPTTLYNSSVEAAPSLPHFSSSTDHSGVGGSGILQIIDPEGGSFHASTSPHLSLLRYPSLVAGKRPGNPSTSNLPI